jgi:hypothetical protein
MMMMRRRITMTMMTSTGRRMYDAYFVDTKDLSPSQIVDVKYVDLMKNPVGLIESIYRQLNLEGFEDVRPKLEEYAAAQKVSPVFPWGGFCYVCQASFPCHAYCRRRQGTWKWQPSTCFFVFPKCDGLTASVCGAGVPAKHAQRPAGR